MSGASDPPSPPGPPRTLLDELGDEPEVVPGTARSGDVVLSWSDHRLRLVRPALAGPQRRVALGPGEIGAVQVSRARRSADGSAGGEPLDFLEVELRGGRFGRIRLSAPAPAELLEGLPWYDAPGTPVELAAARGVIAAARAMGARVSSHGADTALARRSQSDGDDRVPERTGAAAAGVRHRIGALVVHELPGMVRVDLSGFGERSREVATFASVMIVAAAMVLISIASTAQSVLLGLVAAGLVAGVWTARQRRVVALRQRPFVLEVTASGTAPALMLLNETGRLELPLTQVRRFGVERSSRADGEIVAQMFVETQDGEAHALLGPGRFEEPEDCDALCTGLNALVLGHGTRDDFLAAVAHKPRSYAPR